MQGEAHPAIVQPEIGEGHIADDGVDAALGQTRVAEVFDANVMAGVEHACDTAGDAVELYPDETHGGGSQGEEIPDTAAWLQHGRIAGHAQVCECRVHRPDDERRGVEGGEGGAPGAGILLGREERPQLFAQRLPGRILVAASDRIGKYPQGHRAKAGEAGEHGALLGGRGPLGLLDGLERADRSQDSASFGFLAAGGLGVAGYGGMASLEEDAW